jgi:hypothetical protein
LPRSLSRGPGRNRGLEHRDEGLTIRCTSIRWLGRAHQSLQTLTPAWLRHCQQKQLLQRPALDLGQGPQALLQLLGKYRFTATLNRPIETAEDLQPRRAKPAAIAAAPPAIGRARQWL